MKKNAIWGAIIGDIVGSSYEFDNTNDYNFPLFTQKSKITDDTLMTCAVAKWIVDGGLFAPQKLVENMQSIAQMYPYIGFGPRFMGWLLEIEPQPNNSFGNGSAMRVSPIGCYCNTEEDVLVWSALSSMVSHNHPEGVKGAQAIALSIFFARKRYSKEYIKDYIQENFGYNLDRTVDSIKNTYKFDATCQGSVPEAIICYLEGNDFEDVLRKSVSIGGDSDTIACMACSIAACTYDIPDEIVCECEKIIPTYIKKIISNFESMESGN